MATETVADCETEGWYYLHENGDLIWKRFRPEQDSGFVKRIWPCDTTQRGNGWIILIESLVAGASVSRVAELAQKWGCDAHDLINFMVRHEAIAEHQKGVRMFLEHILRVDPDKWFDWLGATPNGEQPDFSTMPTGA